MDGLVVREVMAIDVTPGWGWFWAHNRFPGKFCRMDEEGSRVRHILEFHLPLSLESLVLPVQGDNQEVGKNPSTDFWVLENWDHGPGCTWMGVRRDLCHTAGHPCSPEDSCSWRLVATCGISCLFSDLNEEGLLIFRPKKAWALLGKEWL
jgi:hypothetical protein